MATGITKTTDLGDTIPTVIEEAMFTKQWGEAVSSLVWNSPKDKGKGSTKNFPYWGKVTANQLTEGVDMASPEKMADTNVQVTLNEFGVQVLLTDNLIEDDQEDVIRAAGQIAGRAMVVKQETLLTDLFDSGSVSFGGTGEALTLGMLAGARTLLRGADEPLTGELVAVHHPYTTIDLVDILTPIAPTTTATYMGIDTTTGMAQDVLRNYTIGKVFGMNIVETGNMTASGTDYKGGVFQTGKGGSLILCSAREWDNEPERDASLRATELNIVGRYGVSVYKSAWVAELYNDGTAPS